MPECKQKDPVSSEKQRADAMRSEESKRVGLCADCRHARHIESARGSKFYQCGLSFTNPSFAKYPRLPVLTCRGYEPTDK